MEEDGEQLGILNTAVALAKAEDLSLNLVEDFSECPSSCLQNHGLRSV